MGPYVDTGAGTSAARRRPDGPALRGADPAAGRLLRGPAGALSRRISASRVFAGGIGGQVSATLPAGIAAHGGRPGHAAFVTAFLITAALALLGGVLALFIPRLDDG